MAYKFHAKETEARDNHEARIRAKFDYFRNAEATINAGRGTVEYHPAPVRVNAKTPACGTHSGWARHQRDNTTPCRDCLDAKALYQREYRARKVSA